MNAPAKDWKSKFKTARKGQQAQHNGLIILRDRVTKMEKIVDSAMVVIKSQAALIEEMSARLDLYSGDSTIKPTPPVHIPLLGGITRHSKRAA